MADVASRTPARRSRFRDFRILDLLGSRKVQRRLVRQLGRRVGCIIAAEIGLSELPYPRDGSAVFAMLTSSNFQPWSTTSIRRPRFSPPSAGLHRPADARATPGSACSRPGEPCRHRRDQNHPCKTGPQTRDAGFHMTPPALFAHERTEPNKFLLPLLSPVKRLGRYTSGKGVRFLSCVEMRGAPNCPDLSI